MRPGKVKGVTMIYFICERDSDLVKIGVTDSPNFRLQKLQCGSPHELFLAALMEGGYKDEQRLHAKFHDVWIRGEWFRLNDELRALITANPVRREPVIKRERQDTERREKFHRAVFFLPKAMVAGLAEAAKADPAGLKSSHLIRQFIAEGLQRRKRSAQK